MRVATCGLIVVAVLAAAWSGLSWDGPAHAQQPSRQQEPRAIASRPAMASAGDWMGFSADTGSGPIQITLIDAKSQVMSVYHVDRVSGAIELKSVRRIEWDLRMEEFNGTSPLPRDIRALLEQR